MSSHSLDNATLLLVDDEPTNLHVLRETLKGKYRLIFARSGERALDLAKQELPDLILLDIMMPGMTGLEVCEQLKQLHTTRHIPVIFITALGHDSDASRGFLAGGADYIRKPVSPILVQTRVQTHLTLSHLNLAISKALALLHEHTDEQPTAEQSAVLVGKLSKILTRTPPSEH